MTIRIALLACAMASSIATSSCSADRGIRRLQQVDSSVHSSATVQASASPVCPGDVVTPLTISEDCVGPVPLWLTLDQVQRRFHDTRDTVLGSEGGHPYAGVALSIGGLTLVATQHRSISDVTAAADQWLVAGDSGRLPEGLSLASTWSEFREAYGSAIGAADMRTTVMFCRFPRMFFWFDVDPQLVTSVEQGDFSSMPADARIREVWINRTKVVGWECQK